jgi:hypothetical protein
MQHVHRPQVHDQAVVPLGDRPQMHVERGHLAADEPEHREARLEAGEHHDLAAGHQQGPHDLIEGLRKLVGIGTRAEHVVAARGDADQIGCHRDRLRHLFLGYLAQQLAADGQVRVPQARAGSGEMLGEPVRPPPVAGLILSRVVKALSETVP